MGKGISRKIKLNIKGPWLNIQNKDGTGNMIPIKDIENISVDLECDWNYLNKNNINNGPVSKDIEYKIYSREDYIKYITSSGLITDIEEAKEIFEKVSKGQEFVIGTYNKSIGDIIFYSVGYFNDMLKKIYE